MSDAVARGSSTPAAQSVSRGARNALTRNGTRAGRAAGRRDITPPLPKQLSLRRTSTGGGRPLGFGGDEPPSKKFGDDEVVGVRLRHRGNDDDVVGVGVGECLVPLPHP